MSVALRGNLEDFGIADVFQLVGQQRKTGILEFTGGDGSQVRLRFDRGAVVSAAPRESKTREALGDMLVRCGFLTRDQIDALHAECAQSGQSLPRLAVARGSISEEDLERIEDLLTRETIFAVLRWADGSFDFRAQPVAHRRSFETLLGAEQILMDGLRMVDEWQSFAELVPSDETIFEHVGGFEAYRDQVSGDMARHLDHAEKIYGLIDGRLKVRRVIDLSLLGSFDATRALADLHAAGAIAPVDAGRLQKLAGRGRARALPQADARGWIAMLLPMVLLVGVAVGIHIRNASAIAPGVHRIATTVLELVRDDYATLRVRHALEAHRFSRGQWPRRLERLVERGILPADALASDQGHPYYYVEREDGAVLLAPER
ncbi:MAG: DUF4388 domain-containing protein [Myxococcota bacterium]